MATNVPYPRVGDLRWNHMKHCHEVYDGKDWAPSTGSQYYSNNTVDNNYMQIPSMGSITIGAPPAINMFQVNTPSGTIMANMETGDVSFPPGMHRSAALIEFWSEFSKVYKPSHIELNLAKQEVKFYKEKAKEYEKYAVKETTRKIAEKVHKKYGNEKFIMIKPYDLIKFIKGDI